MNNINSPTSLAPSRNPITSDGGDNGGGSSTTSLPGSTTTTTSGGGGKHSTSFFHTLHPVSSPQLLHSAIFVSSGLRVALIVSRAPCIAACSQWTVWTRALSMGSTTCIAHTSSCYWHHQPYSGHEEGGALVGSASLHASVVCTLSGKDLSARHQATATSKSHHLCHQFASLRQLV